MLVLLFWNAYPYFYLFVVVLAAQLLLIVVSSICIMRFIRIEIECVMLWNLNELQMHVRTDLGISLWKTTWKHITQSHPHYTHTQARHSKYHRTNHMKSCTQHQWNSRYSFQTKCYCKNVFIFFFQKKHLYLRFQKKKQTK